MPELNDSVTLNECAERPVVIGSSLSGVLISLSLSRVGIEHVVIGGEAPAEVPRLGESLNECAGPELWRLFGREFTKYFYTKSHISLLNGDFASMIHIGNPNRKKGSLLQRFTARNGEQKPIKPSRTLFHVDRIGFDRALYRKARRQPCCRFIEKRVVELTYDATRDRFDTIRLDDGSTIERPQYVFDATGPRGLVAEAAGVDRKPISNLQRVVWTHYVSQRRATDVGIVPRDRPWWQFGTNLLRLTREVDGIDGIAWLIPLGTSLSLGISVDVDACRREDVHKSELMQTLARAFACRGIDFAKEFSEQRVLQEIEHRYSVADRAFGSNWLLAAGTFMQIWFPSSAGLWTAVAAASLAPDLLDRPAATGKKYESMMRKLPAFHQLLEEMIHGPPFRSSRDADHFWANWLASIPARLSDYIRLSRNQIDGWRLRYSYLEKLTPLFRRFNSLQLLTWGFFAVRVFQQPDLPRQTDSFPGYFQVILFRAKNYWQGVLRGICSLFMRADTPHNLSDRVETMKSTPHAS